MNKNVVIIVLLVMCVSLVGYFIVSKRPTETQSLKELRNASVVETTLKESYIGRVTKILDGDSIIILDENQRQLNVRLGDIDAPEYDQPYGSQAKQVLTELVLDKAVTIKSQVIDKYGRIVGRVYVGDIDVSAELVRTGSAWVYRKYATDKNLYQLEDKAKLEKLGLWNLLEIERIPPWEWRHNKQESQQTK